MTFVPGVTAQGARDHHGLKKVLLVLDQPAYGADETFNAIRLATALALRDDTDVTVFLRYGMVARSGAPAQLRGGTIRSWSRRWCAASSTPP